MDTFAVIFDMDGLMLDTERMSHKAWTCALAEFGFQLDEATFLRTVGCSVEDTGLILAEVFGPTFEFQTVYKRRQEVYVRDISENGIPLKPGLLELLDFLEENQVVKAIASSAPSGFASLKLSRAGIERRFAAVVCSDHVKRGKPAPDLFLEAARQINYPPRQCLVLEDSEAGIQAASAAGMLPVMVPDIKPPLQEIREMAYRVLPSLREVIPLVEGLLNGAAPPELNSSG